MLSHDVDADAVSCGHHIVMLFIFSANYHILLLEVLLTSFILRVNKCMHVTLHLKILHLVKLSHNHVFLVSWCVRNFH